MLKFEKFSGINNVLPSHRLSKSDLTQASNVDIGLDGEVSRRSGYSEVSALCHKNLWQADGFMLATVDSDLVKTTGAVQTSVYPSLGVSRVWYCNLPDGRTTFSNGLINGITDGTTTTTWGVPTPTGLGVLTDVAGSLFAGDYQYKLTYVRLSDGLESAPLDSQPVAIASGGIVLAGMPTLAGHKINVYLSSHDGAGPGYYAGSTTGGGFSFTGTNDQLVLPCQTGGLEPMPIGTVTAFWRGRVLVAVGPVLYASRAGQWELCEVRRDFKQFSAYITLIQPVDDGVFVGTEKELAFLAGDEFDKLTYRQVVSAATALGSGVEIRGELLQQREGSALGTSMLCIADGIVVAGFSDGQIARLTEGKYKTEAAEVAATFRMNGRIPQYIAIPQ